MTKFEKNIYIAMLAEQCNRFEEMVYYLEDMLKTKTQDCDSNERNLLSIAYKNSVTSKRTALRTVMAYELKEKKKEHSEYLFFIQDYRKKLEDELTSTCENILNSIDKFLLPKAQDAEAKVFYYKMKGDYNRYVAEYAHGELKNRVADAAGDSYQSATEHAKELSPIDPISLGLGLNYSVFYYEVLNNHETACEIAKNTLDLANKELPKIEDQTNEEYSDAQSIINLLAENLEMWKIEAEDR